MAWSLDDVLRRRMPLSLLVKLTDADVRRIALRLAPLWRRDVTEVTAEWHSRCAATITV
jgi:hypothetical protein